MLLSGASQLLQGDLKTAAAELGNAALDDESEAVLWRAALAASLGEWEPAAERFARTVDLVDDYPKVIRSRLRLWGAEAQIEAGDPVGALDYLDRLRADAPTADEAAQIGYLEGQRTAREGRFIEARDIWQRLTESAHQPTRARAIFGITEIMLKNGEIDTRAAIDRLERLRFLWRGGPFELALLRRLGHLYLAADDARAGLAACARPPPISPASGEARGDRRGDERGVPPALSRRRCRRAASADRGRPSEEFRELTPAADGDRMIAALADRLVRVDLLDRAGALLADQVAHRLAGVDKARAGARLAAIRLLDRSPELALEALAAGAADDLPTDLVDERRRLQARALFDLGSEPEALALLDGDARARRRKCAPTCYGGCRNGARRRPPWPSCSTMAPPRPSGPNSSTPQPPVWC
jgi:tetratricopeptide (TPR) repeat protein